MQSRYSQRYGNAPCTTRPVIYSNVAQRRGPNTSPSDYNRKYEVKKTKEKKGGRGQRKAQMDTFLALYTRTQRK